MNKQKVFLVEDSRNMQEALQTLVESIDHLEVAGLEPTEATAIHWAETHAGHWDLAIVDLMLAEGAGFNLIRRLASQPLAGRVVVFSGYVTDVIRKYCTDLGAEAVFHKEALEQLVTYLDDLAPREVLAQA